MLVRLVMWGDLRNELPMAYEAKQAKKYTGWGGVDTQLTTPFKGWGARISQWLETYMRNILI